MTSFVLIPGAGGVAWYWHLVEPQLEAAGHEAIAVDLPADDERAGLNEYADRVVEAIGGRGGVVLVAQSLGGFTAPLVCQRADVAELVFVNAMIPVPGETAGDWGNNTESRPARIAAAARGGWSLEFDDETYFLHDVPRDVIADGEKRQRDQSMRVFAEVCDFERWPAIPIRAIAGRDDRLFPIDFQRKLVRQRLGVEVEELDGGHLVALSNPRRLADLLVSGRGTSR
jgi:pimeloyl-ACP methyl ester carboxylesterase